MRPRRKEGWNRREIMRHGVCILCILMAATFSRVNLPLKVGKYFQRINAFAIRKQREERGERGELGEILA